MALFKKLSNCRPFSFEVRRRSFAFLSFFLGSFFPAVWLFLEEPFPLLCVTGFSFFLLIGSLLAGSKGVLMASIFPLIISVLALLALALFFVCSF